MNHTLFDRKKLKEMQQTGEWPSAHSDILEQEFSDRYEMAERLFEKLDTDLYRNINDVAPDNLSEITLWEDSHIPDKSFNTLHSGPCFGFDVDTMVGPISWYEENSGVNDYVERRKCYVYDWTDGYSDRYDELPEMRYFTKMHEKFKPVLDYYLDECFQDQSHTWQKNLYKLMVIQYNTPTADDTNRVAHRKHNTERFGASHCDETLGGLHLGENYQEFQVQNPQGQWEYVPGLEKNETLWFFGEFSELSGWNPTYHRMILNPAPGLGTRYSFIFDLQARYLGEE